MTVRTIGLIVGIAVAALLIAMVVPRPEPEDEHAHEKAPPKTTNTKKPTITELRKGTGRAVEPGDMVTAHYEAFLQDGTKVDSSVAKKKPLRFLLGGGVIMPGWEIGLEGAREGTKRKLVVPPDLAYGDRGSEDGKIPPKTTITFVLEVLKVEKIEDEPLLDPLLKTDTGHDDR